MNYNDPYTDDNSTKNPYRYNELDTYSFENSRRGQQYIKSHPEPEKQTYSEWRPRGYSYARTNLGDLPDDYYDLAANNILNIYAKSGTGNDLDHASTFIMDNIMATALGKDYREVAKRHDYYSMMFTGRKMESKDGLKAFADSWATDKLNRKAASYMNRFDATDDEEERTELMRKMEKLDTEILKRGDYTDRGFFGNMAISSAPVMRQVAKAIGITAAGFGVGYLGGAASILANSGNASKAVAMALKAAKYTKAASIGHKAGAAVNMLDTFLTESGSFSRELYNMVDANGNRVSDETRVIAKLIYGTLATAIEYATIEPSMDKFIKAKNGGQKIAKTPFMQFVRGHFATNYLWTNITGGIGESVEELLQAATSSVAQDVAKNYSDETGKTSFGKKPVSDVLYDAWIAGEDAFLAALGPSIIAGAVPNIPESFKSTIANKRANPRSKADISGDVNPLKWLNQFNNPEPYGGSDKDIWALWRSAGKYQDVSFKSTMMDMDKIRVKSEKPRNDYGAVSADGKAAEKLGPIDVMPDPDVNGQWVGVTEADKDKLKWLFNKGVEGVAVNVVSMADITEIDSASMQNLASQYNGKLDGDTLVVGSQKDLDALRKDLEGFGIKVDENDNSFAIRASEDSGETTMRLSTTDPDSDIYGLKKQIREASPYLSDEEAAIAARLTAIADAGTGTIKYEKSYKAQTKKKDFRGATDAAKSLIYVGKKSDSSTFVHELFHAVSAVRQGEARELSNTIRKALGDNDAKARLTAFISDNIAIWGENAKIESIMKTLESIVENGDATSWSKAQNEALARLYEAYRGSKDSISSKLPEGIRKVLEKLSEYIRKVYGTLKNTNSLNEDIAAAYDKLMGFDSMQDEKSMAERQKSFNEFKASPKEKALFQSINPTELDREIDNITEEDIGNRNTPIVFSRETPAVFRSVGLNNLSMEMYKEKLARALFLEHDDKKNNHGHKDSIDKDIVKEVARKLADPIAVFASKKAGKLVALYDIEDLDNHWVMISIDPNRLRGSHEINLITSIYGRNNELSYSKWVEDGRLLYYDDKKDRELAVRLRLPSVNSLSKDSVLSKSELVNNNILKQDAYGTAKEIEASDSDLLFQEVTDKEQIKELEDEETIKVYRSMQLIDGKLYPPMAEKVQGKRQQPTELGKWYKADERPDLAKKKKDGKYYFSLNKTKEDGKTGTVSALYNPYWHTTTSPLNDQFTSAYKRPNLVVVEAEIPASELTSGYRADKANDPVGEKNWHKGTVSAKLAKLGEDRTVILSRYNKINRILSNEEVATAIAEKLDGTGIAIPDNVVSPGLLEELKKKGIAIEETEMVREYNESQEILYQDGLDNKKQKKPENLLSVDALNGLSKSLSGYSSNDVQVLIENNIYVPTSILTRLSSSRNVNPAIAEEIGIRKLISRFVTDSDKETASLSPNLRSFIEKMKAEKETAWNSEMEKMYTKYYIYSKVLTPTEMRSQFIEENQTMNQLLSLKEVLTKRRVYYRDSKTGKMIGRLYVPKAGYVYEQISQLTKDSPEAVVNNIRASIRKDTDAWIKAYIRSARDFEKINAVSSGDRKVDETKLGSERWLRATAEMGYLAFGDLDFAYAEKLRLASAEGGKDLMADAMKLNEASYSQDYAESARSSLPPELATLAERKNEEMKKAILGEREKSASKIENLKQEKKDAKEKAKADKEKAVKEAVEWERFKRQYSEYEIKERYEKRIKELKQKQEDDIIALRLKQYDRIDAIKDEYRDKMENQAERYRKWRKLSEQNIKDYYDRRIGRLKAWYAERTETEKVDRSIKKGLNVNLATYDYSLVEASSYLYDLINNNERKSDYRISDSDYEGLKTRKGTIDESEGIVEFYNLMVDADGNIVEDPFSGIDIPLGEERFDRTAIPDILSRYLTADTIAEINNKEKSWAKMSLQSKKNIEQALAFARADAKSRLARRKEAQAIDRNAQARESVADVLKSDIDLSDDMLSQIAKEMGEDWKAISKDAKSKAEFKEKAERYFRRNNGRMPAKEIGKLREAVNKVTQLYGQFQRFAKLMGDNVYHNFVEVPQKALDERKGNITRRNSLGDEEFGKILSDGTGKDKKGSYRHDKAKLDWLNASYEVGSAFGGDSKTKLSGWNMVGAYMYSKNIHGFVKLISRTGNDIAIEEIARINPKSTLEFINEELRQRYEFAIIEEGRRLNALAEQREFKPKKLNSILSGYDEARLLRIKKEIESSSMTSTLPSYATALGDKIIELMANETERVEKTAYSLYNSPFKMQSNYVPLYGKDSAHRDSAINGVKSKGDRVYRGMIADRTMADNYALMLEPVTVYRNAIREQETFINMTKVVNDLNWLMSERGGNLHRLIANQYGSTMANVFERQIETLAFTRTPLLGYETIGNKLVSNASAAAVAFNLPSIIKNFVSEITSLAEGDFKGRDLMYAIREISMNRDYWDAKYKALAPDIADSTFSFDYQMLKDSNSLNKYGKRKTQVLEAGLKGLEWADRKAKMTVWIASFQNGIESGMSEQDAAVKATLLVKRTQSVSNPDALSAAQRDENPWHRAIFAFTKDTFQIWNQLTLGIANDLSRGENMKAFEKAIGALLTSAILAVLAGGWLPDKDDDEFDPQEFFRDWIAQLMEYTPIVGSGIKGGIDGWDSDLITLPNELGRLMGMPFNKKDYTWQEYGKQIFDIVGSGASSMAGVPVGALNKAKKSVFADGITEGVKLDPGYLYSSAVGDWLYNADMLDLLDSLF